MIYQPGYGPAREKRRPIVTARVLRGARVARQRSPYPPAEVRRLDQALWHRTIGGDCAGRRGITRFRFPARVEASREIDRRKSPTRR